MRWYGNGLADGQTLYGSTLNHLRGVNNQQSAAHLVKSTRFLERLSSRLPMGNADKVIGCGCCVAVLITIIVLLSISFSSLEQLDYGLNYNSISLQIEDNVYDTAGLYFLGVGHYFIKYPRVSQVIEFSADENDRLQTRTSDGLPVKLSISFQYRYNAGELRQLYLTYKQREVEVYENTAKAVIANAATNFTAYTFFNDKQGIATEMQIMLTRVFDAKLMARIDAFQITRVELPTEFQDAILRAPPTHAPAPPHAPSVFYGHLQPTPHF